MRGSIVNRNFFRFYLECTFLRQYVGQYLLLFTMVSFTKVTKPLIFTQSADQTEHKTIDPILYPDVSSVPSTILARTFNQPKHSLLSKCF